MTCDQHHHPIFLLVIVIFILFFYINAEPVFSFSLKPQFHSPRFIHPDRLIIGKMGACCTKESVYKTDDHVSRDKKEQQHDYDYDYDYEEINVRKGDCRVGRGSIFRVNGSSRYVSMATRKGMKTMNQDAMSVCEDFLGEKEVFFCGVFDGHGAIGQKVSRRVRDNLPSKLADHYHNNSTTTTTTTSCVHGGCTPAAENCKEEDDNQNDSSAVDKCNNNNNNHFESWKSTFETAFKEMDKDLSLDTTIDGAYSSGTTAVTLVKHGDQLIIGNLGDSRAVLCRRGEKGQAIPLQLTVDLKPSIKDEAERIKHCNGRVFGTSRERHVLRVWQPDMERPGLAMTRSFGDFCLKDYGIISTPQLFCRRISEYDEFVVLASDGIWDVLTNFEVVRIVDSVSEQSRAAEVLVRYAARAWRMRFPRARVDDISVVCLFFNGESSKFGSEFSYITTSTTASSRSSSSSSWLLSAVNSRKNSPGKQGRG